MENRARIEELRTALGLDVEAPSDAVKTVKSVAFASPVSATIKEPEVTSRLGNRPRLPPQVEYWNKICSAARFINTPILLGGVTFLVLFGLLSATKPGFLGIDVLDEQGNSVRKADVKLCFWASASAAVLVIVAPYIIRLKTTESYTTYQQNPGLQKTN